MPDATLLGGTRTVTLCGHDYEAQDPRDFKVESEFARWTESQALLFLVRHRQTLGETEYRRLMDQVPRDAAAGVYAFEGEVCWMALRSPAGIKEMAYLQIARAEAGKAPTNGRGPIERELIERAFADPATALSLANLVLEQGRGPNLGSAAPMAAP